MMFQNMTYKEAKEKILVMYKLCDIAGKKEFLDEILLKYKDECIDELMSTARIIDKQEEGLPKIYYVKYKNDFFSIAVKREFYNNVTDEEAIENCSQLCKKHFMENIEADCYIGFMI